MGNCIRKGSSTQWGGEDWGSFGSGDKISTSSINDAYIEQKGGVLSSNTLPTGSTEVKIKISKKQLDQVINKAKVQELSVDQVLVHLINDADHDRFEARPRPWRPALQSIPELGSI